MPLKKQKKPSTYNRLFKEFTKINSKLPEDRKLSIKERRKFVREELLPQYKDVPSYKLRVKQIKSSILKIYEKIPPKEICDLNYIDPSEFAYVEWFNLDETISQLVPDCIYVKVSAGDYGETNIFNTRNYQYGKNGVRAIVEEVRGISSEEPSGSFIFSGYQKLRPRKRNDGTPENYYLDFILIYIDKDNNEQPYEDTETTRFELPKTREVRDKKKKISNVIEARIKQLKSKKDSRKRAKKSVGDTIKKISETNKKIKKKSSKTLELQKVKDFNRASTLLDKYLKDGKITKEEYDKNVEKLLKSMGYK